MLRAVFSFVILVLGVSLLALWVDHQGRIRRIHWTPPAPLPLDANAMVATLPARGEINPTYLLQTLERPVFSPSRRPPPPPPPPEPTKAKESAPPLTDVHVFGLYGSDRSGGAILRVDGKNQRVTVNESVKGWRLVSIGERTLSFRRGGRQHVLELVHVIPKVDPSSAIGASGVAGGAQVPARSSRATRNVRPSAATDSPSAVISSPSSASSPASASSSAGTAPSFSPAAVNPPTPPRFGGPQSAKKP